MALLRSLLYVGFIAAVIGGWFLNRRKSRQEQKPEDAPVIDLADPDALQAALKHARWQYRLAAVAALQQLPGSETLSTLIEMLNDPVLDVREAASDGVAGLGDRAIPALAEVLAVGSLPAREAAIRALCAIGTPATIPLLIQSLQEDQSAWVRIPAAKGLAAIGGNEATAALHEALNDPHPDVSAAVQIALKPKTSITN